MRKRYTIVWAQWMSTTNMVEAKCIYSPASYRSKVCQHYGFWKFDKLDAIYKMWHAAVKYTSGDKVWPNPIHISRTVAVACIQSHLKPFPSCSVSSGFNKAFTVQEGKSSFPLISPSVEKFLHSFYSFYSSFSHFWCHHFCPFVLSAGVPRASPQRPLFNYVFCHFLFLICECAIHHLPTVTLSYRMIRCFSWKVPSFIFCL